MNQNLNCLPHLFLLFATLAFPGCQSPVPAPVPNPPPEQQQQQTDQPPKTYENAAMLEPTKATETAPDKYQVKFVTTKGDIVVEVTRGWSPNGADRFYNLVKIGYFDDVVIFRSIKDFMFQFGIHGDPAVNKKWGEAKIKDDPNAGISNTKGMITFAKTGLPNSRSVQFFINLGNNAGLDPQGFTPFGKVVAGLDILEKINTEYGENGREDQGRFQAEGNAFILGKYPNLDLIKSAELVKNQP